jgi:hypothetical protein
LGGPLTEPVDDVLNLHKAMAVPYRRCGVCFIGVEAAALTSGQPRTPVGAGWAPS